MNKKLAAALSGGAVLVVALSGCSSKKDSAPDPKLVAWAKTVCDAVPAQDAKIRSANASIAKIATDSDLPPKTAKATYSQAFQDMADGYKALAAAINGAGAPPGVDDGAKRQQDAAKNLSGLSSSYAGLKKQVDELDTKDQGKFAQGLRGVADQTKQIGEQSNSGTEALKRLEQGDVKAAMAKQPSCQVAATASASATTG
ncbi:small secreted protein [Streptomyces diastatochromogenes]|uniref:Small secreted protein n=1 Tax=Streptomyces diastatochromogenes TaxID=42236 RepID=A0A233SDF6_STRDA|nr:small secreted protein [Streptomyces diastatochromogenes]OXY93696.1 small secreted protein [Streptomyces diastatochromogenes]